MLKTRLQFETDFETDEKTKINVAHMRIQDFDQGKTIGPNSHRTRDATRSKWDLLWSMGEFTLHASKIKGKTFQFVCASHHASCVN